MKNKNIISLKSGVWYTFSNVLVKSITLLTTPIFIRILTKTDYGNYNNYLSWQNVVLIIVPLNLEASLISAKYDYKDRFKEYVLSILTLSTLSGAVWTVIVNIFEFEFSELFGIAPVYINLMLLYSCFYSAVNIFQVSERFQYKYKSVVLIGLLIAFGTAAVSFLLVFIMDDRLMGRTVGGILPTVLIGFVLYVIIAIQGRKIDTSSWKYALRVCLPYVPHLLSLTVLNSMDRVMITRICGADDNALYSVAYSCGAMVTILLTSMNTAFSPWLGDNLHEKNYADIRIISKYYILSFCYLALGIMLLAPEVLLIMGGNQYLEAKYVMTPVSMGCVCQFLYTMYVNIEQYEKKTVGMAFVSAGAALLNLVLNAFFIPAFGYVAAAYTTLAGYLFLLIVHMLLVWKICYSQAYDTSMVVKTVITMLVFTVGINFLYMSDIIRYAVIFVYAVLTAVIIFKNKNMIQNLVTKVFNRGSVSETALMIN